MSDDKKIGSYKFIAEPFHVDFNGRLTIGVLGNHLLNCAGFHASERGFGIATLNEDNYTWVFKLIMAHTERAYPIFLPSLSIMAKLRSVKRRYTFSTHVCTVNSSY